MSHYKSPRAEEADAIVKNHVLWSMGAGFIPIPIADILAVTAIQLDMVKQLCRLYGIDYQESKGKAIVATLTGSTLARVAAYGAGSVFKFIPGLGTLLGGVTVSVFSGASTYATGEVFKRHMESGGTIWNLDAGDFKKVYQEKFEQGKKIVQDWKKEHEAGQAEQVVEKDAATKLKELADLLASGVITKEEFKAMKDKLFRDFVQSNGKSE